MKVTQMARMNIRATYALDQETANRIKHLARVWGVSQAEVIRRSIQRAAEEEAGDVLTPADVVAHYLSEPLPRSKAEARAWMDSSRQLRREDDAHRAGAH